MAAPTTDSAPARAAALAEATKALSYKPGPDTSVALRFLANDVRGDGGWASSPSSSSSASGDDDAALLARAARRALARRTRRVDDGGVTLEERWES